jgi:peptide/nickel transport system substrate-binding protein
MVNPGELETWPPVEIASKIKSDRFVAIFFNTQDPKLGDKSTRQALAYALDKNWEPRAFNPINPRSWAYNPNVKAYRFDLAKARELLNKVNGGGEGMVELEEIELSTIPSLLAVAEEIKEDWEKLEIKVKIKILNSLDEPFEALLVTQEIPADPDQYFLWHSTQAANISHYKSPKLDKLLEDGRKELDQEKRKEIYQDFQRFLLEDLPAIFLFHPTVYTISRK